MTLAVRLEEQELDRLAIELFTNHETHFTPTHPWVFVRVLPREQRIGLIWAPEFKQNKPVHEGIVLSTWKPFKQEWRQKENDVWVDCERERKSDFAIGDHVTYPWAAGMPISGWDETKYRIVPEHVREHRGIDHNGIIFGKLNYPRESIEERLAKLIDKSKKARNPSAALLDLIRKDFDIIARDMYSKTTSGK